MFFLDSFDGFSWMHSVDNWDETGLIFSTDIIS